GARRRNVTQIALRTQAVGPFVASFLDLARRLDVSNEASLAAIQSALEQAWPFAPTGSIDLIGLVMKLLNHPDAGVRSAAQGVLDRWSSAVAARAVRGGEDYANGVAIYAPPAGRFDASYVTLADQIGLDAWGAFLQRYHARREEAIT
ncbi:MAG: hypothetical protein IAI50_18020, partial [Candidatus Eremiobacteraeota bacterium]|nr:hypothetical protein [Candidatus Eremiobacteraeota bacterium]